MNQVITRKLLGLITLIVLPVVMWGQGVTTSSMNGRVTDQQGKALVGATVVATHTPSGSVYGNNTNGDGFFRIPNMRVGGPYSVKVTYVGYDDFLVEGIYLNLGQAYRLDVKVAEAGVTIDGVEITSSRSAIFDGNRTGAETVVTEAQINALPTVARAIGDFARLTPQATVREGGDGFSISIAGQNNRYNAIYIDGAVNNDVFGLAGSGTNGGQTGVSPFSLDAIEELQISVAPFDVRIGGFAGGAINAVTRSGSNNIEASVYGFGRNQGTAGLKPDRPDRAEWEADNPGLDYADEFNLADFNATVAGFRIGGPIIKDKAFFFVNAELQNEETPLPVTGEHCRIHLDHIRKS
ncbi:MAG: carboxypeptidase regulatory-like domain-containing protein [Bacteroidota bacterium]